MKASRSIVALLSAVACCVAAPPAFAQCTKDDECKGSRVCEKGQCVDPTPSSVACNADRDCAGDLICHDARCVAPRRAASPMAPSVAIQVTGPEGARVDLIAASGAPQSCSPPCSLLAPPGSAQVEVRSDDRTFRETVVISGQSRALSVAVRKSATVPAVVLSLGVAALAGGVGMMIAGRNNDGDGPPWLFVGGAVSLGAGIACSAWGLGSLARLGDDRLTVSNLHVVPVPRLALTPTVWHRAPNGATGALIWRF